MPDRYPFSSTKHALGELAAGQSGPSVRTPEWEPRIQSARMPETVGAWVRVGALFYGKASKDREGLGVPMGSERAARILAWASTSDEARAPLNAKDRVIIRKLASLLREFGLVKDLREVAHTYRRKFWFELPLPELPGQAPREGGRHVQTLAIDE